MSGLLFYRNHHFDLIDRIADISQLTSMGFAAAF